MPRSSFSSSLICRASLLFLGVLAFLAVPRARAQDAWEDMLSRNDPLYDLRKEIKESLKQKLAASQPGLAGALDAGGSAAKQAPVRDALVKLLSGFASAPAETKPAVLLGADLLAKQLYCAAKGTTSCNPLAGAKLPVQLTWEMKKPADGWFYRRDLLLRVSKEYADTPWGEMAFILLLDNGYSTAVNCDPQRDAVREVIREGESYLSARPSSPRRAAILFLVAQAYDAWWSLSQSESAALLDDAGWSEVGAAERYQAGAAQAREKALRYYQEAAKLAPGSKFADKAARQIPILQKSYDTNQRAYYCFAPREK